MLYLKFGRVHDLSNKEARTSPAFLISNCLSVLNAVWYLLGNSPAPEFYMPTFRNIMSHLHMRVGVECCEASAYKIQTPGNYPEESIQRCLHCSCVLVHSFVQPRLVTYCIECR